MTFWERITGSDITKQLKALNARANKFPYDYQVAWKKINVNLLQHSDFTGRNVIPILEGVIELLEQAIADGLSINEVFDDDIKGFCSTLASEEGAKNFRDKWRNELNNNIAKKLGK